MSNAAFRVDASPDIGSGHLMRCLTLADCLKERGGQTRFLSRQMPEQLAQLARDSGHELVRLAEPAGRPWSQRADAQETLRALGDRKWDWLVVDHYSLDADWESALRAAADRVLVIDDLADRAHDCDVLIDQNLFTDPVERYSGKLPNHCTLLLGPRYALLRGEFALLHDAVAPRSGSVRRILVSFGGVDRSGHTRHAVHALADLGIDGLQVDVVIGMQHPQREEVAADCGRLGFACHIETRRMAELMAKADLSIGAGGSTTWERCCLGLPALAVCAAENQRRVVEEAASAGLVYAPALQAGGAALTDHLRALLDNPALLSSISRKGRDAVDGRGALRVARAMSFTPISVRAATADDSAMMLSWRNHPEIRRFSRNDAPVDRRSHEAWLAAVLADRNRALLIGQHAGMDIGVVRFDISDQEAEVSIYVAPESTGSGIGVELLLAAEAWLTNHRPAVRTILAEVLQDNRASHRMFESGGYARRRTIYAKELQRQ